MENSQEKITREIVQLIKQLKLKTQELEKLGYRLELNNIPDSNRYGKPQVNVFKPIIID